MEPVKITELRGIVLKLLLAGPDQFTLADLVRLQELLGDE